MNTDSNFHSDLINMEIGLGFEADSDWEKDDVPNTISFEHSPVSTSWPISIRILSQSTRFFHCGVNLFKSFSFVVSLNSSFLLHLKYQRLNFH